MLRFTGVLVLLALASQCANGQPTLDDSVLDGNELLEEMMTYLQRIIVHQEQQQRVQDERMERLEQMLNETVEGQRRLEMQVGQLQQQQVEHQVTILAMSQKLRENEERGAELCRDQVGNVSLEEKFTEVLSNVTQSQQQLFTEVVKEVERKMNESFTSSKQSHAELVGHITDKSNEIQVGLRRVQDDVRTCNERQLLGRNMTIMLAEIQGTCESIASSVNTTEELLTEELQQHRRLLGAVNQTCATTAEQSQSLQPLNNALNNISAQLVTIHDIQYGVRLVGCGHNQCSEGRLEVWAYGSWGTVCDDDFDTSDARVACYSLGFGRLGGRPIGHQYGAGSGPILLDNLHCSGSESSLFRCRHRGVGRHNCVHGEDISISCYRR